MPAGAAAPSPPNWDPIHAARAPRLQVRHEFRPEKVHDSLWRKLTRAAPTRLVHAIKKKVGRRNTRKTRKNPNQENPRLAARASKKSLLLCHSEPSEESSWSSHLPAVRNRVA